jgi:hypothetical protein
MSEVPRKILLIFDIDETLIQFIPGKYAEKILPKIKDFNFEYEQDDKTKNFIIFRPHIKKLFDFFKKNHEDISVAIWTYSERDYADVVAAAISRFCNLGGADFFIFRYGVEDIEDEDFPKSLPHIWDNYPEFNKFNTFLVDDRAANLYHPHNKSNSIIIEPFAPFGTEKERKVMSDEYIEEELHDNQFVSLLEVCQGLIQDVQGCDDEDIMCAIDTEHIFSEKRVNRIGLDKFIKQYDHKGIEIDMMTLGDVHTDAKFKPVTGGKRRIGRKTRKIRITKQTMRKGKKSKKMHIRKSKKQIKSKKYRHKKMRK